MDKTLYNQMRKKIYELEEDFCKVNQGEITRDAFMGNIEVLKYLSDELRSPVLPDKGMYKDMKHLLVQGLEELIKHHEKKFGIYDKVYCDVCLDWALGWDKIINKEDSIMWLIDKIRNLSRHDNEIKLIIKKIREKEGNL